jgi:hypothetical protein
MADPDADVIHVRGEGGSVFALALPLSEPIAERLTKGHIRRVNDDGSEYTAPAEPSGEQVPSLPTQQPALSAAKSEWIGWAVVCGEKPDDAEALTKGDLIEKYATKGPSS